MKKVLLLGSTGSIGENTLKVLSIHKDKFHLVGVSAKSNFELLKRQVEKFKVKHAVIVDYKKDYKLKNTKIFFGEEGILQLIEETKPDILINAIVGINGLNPLFFAIKKNIKKIALANKESIVTAGDILIKEVKKNKVELFPIDSEHSSLWQCLKNEDVNNVEKVTITASGGPLFKKKLKEKTAEKIVSHPVWKMGKKISVDSATMVNKGFEYVEAHYLFNLPYEKINILIHPQVLFHSFVKFIDGNILACMFYPDMRIPISYALGCGKERIRNMVKSFDLLELNKVEFYKPDFKKFPLLKLLIDCAKTGFNSYLVTFNAVNEVLVENFINYKIAFDDIYKILKKIIYKHKPFNIRCISDIFLLDKQAREYTSKIINKLN